MKPTLESPPPGTLSAACTGLAVGTSRCDVIAPPCLAVSQSEGGFRRGTFRESFREQLQSMHERLPPLNAAGTSQRDVPTTGSLDRRNFLKGSLLATAAATLANPRGLSAVPASANAAPANSPDAPGIIDTN